MRRKTRKGAASAAPTSITGVRGLAHDPAVLNWVRESRVEGCRRSRSSPRPPRAPTTGPVPARRSRTARWPRVARRSSTSRCTTCASRSSPTSARDRSLRQARSCVSSTRAPTRRQPVLTARIDISKATQRSRVDFLEWGLRDADPETMTSIYDELTILASWVDVSLGVVAHEITDLKKLELIRKLRDTTGRSPEEAQAFLRQPISSRPRGCRSRTSPSR